MGQDQNLREVHYVWIIEENILFKKNIISLINESPNFRCNKSFDNCKDAVNELRISWEPEIILIDAAFAGNSCLDGIMNLKKISPGSFIILLTIYDEDDIIFPALCSGASGYLVKSSSEDTIIESITEILRGGSVMNPLIAKKAIDLFIKRKNSAQSWGYTEKEKELLEMMVKGLTKEKIAHQLSLSLFSIDTHLRSIYAKLHLYPLNKQ